MGDYEVGNKVEVYVRDGAKIHTFQSQLVHIDLNKGFVTWDKGDLVDPQMMSKYGLPPHLEGVKVFPVSLNADFTSTNSYWGKLIRKVLPVKKNQQLHLPEPGGMNCVACNKFFQYASTNMSDGTFACRHCRKYKKWKLPKGATYIGFEGER